MGNRMIFYSLAVVGAVLALVFFIAPWMKIEIDSAFWDTDAFECVTTPSQDEYTGAKMALKAGRLANKTEEFGGFESSKCIQVAGAWYLFWTPVTAVIGLVLAGALILAERGALTLFATRLAAVQRQPGRVYVGIGAIGLLLHLYSYADFYVLPVKSGVTGPEVFHLQHLASFWLSTLGMVLILVAGLGLLPLAKETEPAEAAAEAAQ